MADIFHQKIRESLADDNLQAALDANAERRVTVRQQAFASLPDHQELRQRAHAMRADVVAHLDEYLAKFVSKAQEHGIVVHRAADAAQANQIVLEIARRHDARLIAKSKTMVSEEIGLNHALEAAGLQVVETDLGEYIVQLRGEPPAHIITPAVHLRRADVGQLFHEKLGIPLTEDIPTMTAAARRFLRETFLRADIGLSGVNFAVAETGTLCVLTNEGNGRMVTTVPKVHIALLGMERLAPTLNDLALMLALLPRSATGQKITVYASLLHGPRRPEDPDGPLERHVIIIDNGRSRLRQSPLQEMLYCIRCGACLNACPVFREVGGHAYVSRTGKNSAYPGPMGSVLSPALFGQADFGQLARASSLCGACREACPVDIDLPKLLLRVRAGMVADETISPNAPPGLSAGLRLFSWAATSPLRFAMAQKLAALSGWLAGLFWGKDGWLRLPAVTGWGQSKDFPRPKAPSPLKPGMARPAGEPTGEAALEPIKPVITQAPAGDEAVIGTGEQAFSEEIPLVERIRVELAALGAGFVRCAEGDVGGKVVALLRERKMDAVLAWCSAHLPLGLLDELEAAGIRVIYPTAEGLGETSLIRAGLTGAVAAAAETGTLAIPGGPGRALGASLLPELHIAVLREADILPTLSELLRVPDLRQAAAAVLVSGPSRTADIEMTLTIGVHGPGELQVICY